MKNLVIATLLIFASSISYADYNDCIERCNLIVRARQSGESPLPRTMQKLIRRRAKEI